MSLIQVTDLRGFAGISAADAPDSFSFAGYDANNTVWEAYKG